MSGIFASLPQAAGNVLPVTAVLRSTEMIQSIPRSLAIAFQKVPVEVIRMDARTHPHMSRACLNWATAGKTTPCSDAWRHSLAALYPFFNGKIKPLFTGIMLNNKQLQDISKLLDKAVDKGRLSGIEVPVRSTGVGNISSNQPIRKKST